MNVEQGISNDEGTGRTCISSFDMPCSTFIITAPLGPAAQGMYGSHIFVYE
jgi:hypothetical protein